MESELLLCPSCHSPYDQLDLAPRILPSCGHTICTCCLRKFLEIADQQIHCPFDGSVFCFSSKDVEKFPVNFALKQIIIKKSNRDMCHEHDKKLKIVCLTDKCKICNFCVQYGEHKGHNTKLIKQIEAEAETKMNECQFSLDHLDTRYKEIGNLIKEKRDIISKFIRNGFNDIKEAFEKRQNQLLAQVNFFLDVESHKAEEIIGSNSGCKRIMTERLNRLSNIFQNNHSFEVLEEELPTTKLNSLYKLLEGYINDLNIKLEVMLNNLDEFIQKNISENATEYEFPMKRLTEDMNSIWKKAKEVFGPSTKDPNYTMKTLFDFYYHNADNKTLIKPRIIDDEGILVNGSNPQFDQCEKATTIELIFNKDELSRSMAIELLNVIKRQRHATNILLDLSDSNIRDQELSNICSAMLYLHNQIQVFKLNVSGCAVGDQSLTFIAAKLFPKLNHLRQITLDVGLTKVTDQTVKGFASHALPYLKELEYLEFNFDFTEISDDSFSDFDGIHMEQVKTLILNLESSRISSQSLLLISKNMLSKIKTLHKLELRLYATEIEDIGVCELFESNLPTLRSLVLDLEKTQISNSALAALGQKMLTEVRNIETLELRLGSTKVTDEGVLNIMEKATDNIKSLTLYLNNTEVSDRSIDLFIYQVFPNMKELKHLEFKLDRTLVTEQRKQAILEIEQDLAQRTEF